MSGLPAQLPHGTLTEVLPDVFVVDGMTRPTMGSGSLEFTRNMTVVRDGGDLTMVNTVRLDEAGLAALESLGHVAHLVKLGAYHGRDDLFYLQRYGVLLWAFDGMPHERGVVTDRTLGAETPLSDGTSFVYDPSDTVEGTLLLARHGGVLLACDSLQNMLEPDRWFNEPAIAMMRRSSFFGPANIGPGWLHGATPQRSDFDRLLELPFQHLLSAHGTPLLHDAKPAVRATVDRVFGPPGSVG